MWRQFDERCCVQVKGRVGSVLTGMLGPPGEEHYDVIGDALNELFKAPWRDFDARRRRRGHVIAACTRLG
jgi:hypothetical protein